MSRLCKKSCDSPVFAQPKLLPCIVLPTYEDIMRACQNERINLLQYSSKEPAFSVIYSKVTCSLVAVWETASIPIVSKKPIKDGLRLS